MSSPAISKPKQHFVQTQRQAHVEWGKLCAKKPMAAACLHQLVALMDRRNAVAISHSTLAKLLACDARSVRRGVAYLVENKWIQKLQMGSSGTLNAYCINDRVAWADARDNLKLSLFTANIVVDAADQDEYALASDELRKVPIIYPPERALPEGDIDEGEQAQLPGMEPTLEGRQIDLEELTDA